jgi:transcription elongation factor GreB
MDIAWGCMRLSTKLITKEGHEALKKELDYLWREKRPDTTRKVTWAASLGDRSENADYAQAPQRNYYFERAPYPSRPA